MAIATRRTRRAAVRSARKPRASAEDLYRTCKQSGTCPPDVINKIEGTTLADQILKWAGFGLYLGGLGIGTGSGTGGRTGYVPLGGGSRGAGVRPATTRPPIGPPRVAEDVITLRPEDPSVVGADSTVVGGGVEVPEAPRVVPSAGGTTVIEDGTAIEMEVLTSQPVQPAHGTAVTHSDTATQFPFHNPAFHSPYAGFSESSFSPHTTIIAGDTGRAPVVEFELQTFPQSSTPLQQVTRGSTALARYTNYTEQVHVGTDTFFSSPQRLVTYNNPAYDGSILDPSATLSFEADPEAPDPAFQDIIRLHRPAYSRAPGARGGRVRVSRVGQRLGTVSTRRGTNIGGRVHFFRDVSSIPPDSIELQTLSSASPAPPSSEDPLWSYYDPEADLDLPSLSVGDPSSDYDSVYRPTGGAVAGAGRPTSATIAPVPGARRQHILVPLQPSVTDGPEVSGYMVYADYVFDPSLWRRRRKSWFPLYFADEFVAA
nr:MAG: L2 protein [Arctocephalus gazella papillomavirus 2]